MDTDYPTINEPATPDYVLAVLRDEHRQQCGYDDCADPTAVLTFDSTVAEWRQACDLVDWRGLGRAYNQLWRIRCSDAEWYEVLEPARQRRLDEVCALIARNTFRPRIRPARLFGCTCTPAGAFLTIRALLGQAGADPKVIRPSTPLAWYTRRYWMVLLWTISQLAPGSLPPVRVRTPIYDAALWGLQAGCLCWLLAPLLFCFGGFWGPYLLMAVGGLVAAPSYALTWVAARWLLPASVEFGSLQTFRDLARVVGEGSGT